MMIRSKRDAVLVLAIFVALMRCAATANPPDEKIGSAEAVNESLEGRGQIAVSLDVRVIDPLGGPIGGVTVRPWALGGAQGHATWPNGKYDRTAMDPRSVRSDNDGRATVIYPKWVDPDEGVRTTTVSIKADHPGFAHSGSVHIPVPHRSDDPFEVRLEAGYRVPITPMIDGEPVGVEAIHAMWSGPRSWQSDGGLVRDKPNLSLPPLAKGSHSVLLAKVKRGRITHFSRIVDFVVDGEFDKSVPIEMRAVRPIRGRLSNNVTRPVKNGRVSLRTLSKPNDDDDRVSYRTWCEIESDGSFEIAAWPTDEVIQAIALCDGFMAKSGGTPLGFDEVGPAMAKAFYFPQVFDPQSDDSASDDRPIIIEMVRRSEFEVSAVDEEGEPVAGVEIAASPNVAWWGGGSQIYGAFLIDGPSFFVDRRFESALDDGFSDPFLGLTDRFGKVTLSLPSQHRERIEVMSDVYEIPVVLGRRSIVIETGDPAVADTDAPDASVKITLLPKGTERLGDWDDLVGVVYGCSTPQGRRFLALPGMREQMDRFTQMFKDAEAIGDKDLKAEAYAILGRAFGNVGNYEQAAVWYRKAADLVSVDHTPMFDDAMSDDAIKE